MYTYNCFKIFLYDCECIVCQLDTALDDLGLRSISNMEYQDILDTWSLNRAGSGVEVSHGAYMLSIVRLVANACLSYDQWFVRHQHLTGFNCKQLIVLLGCCFCHSGQSASGIGYTLDNLHC